MLTITDYQAIAQIANAALAEEYAMHALEIDPPTITPAMVRLVISETNRYTAAKPAAAKPEQRPKAAPKPVPKPVPKPTPKPKAPETKSDPDDTQLLDLVRTYSHNGIMFSAAMFDAVKPDDAPNMAVIVYQLGCTMPHLAKRAGLRYNPHHWKGAKRDKALAAFAGGKSAQRVAEKLDESASMPGATVAKQPATKVAESEPETEALGAQSDAFFRNGT